MKKLQKQIEMNPKEDIWLSFKIKTLNISKSAFQIGNNYCSIFKHQRQLMLDKIDVKNYKRILQNVFSYWRKWSK